MAHLEISAPMRGSVAYAFQECQSGFPVDGFPILEPDGLFGRVVVANRVSRRKLRQ